MGVPSAGYASQLGIDTANPTTKRFEFASCGLALHGDIIDANGVTGSRSRDKERTRDGLQHINGPIEMEPTAVEWALLLPWILGGAVTGGPNFSYALGELQPTRFVQVDKIAKVYTYASCAVNRFTLSGGQDQALKCILEVIGISETPGNAGTFPALAIDLTTAPFVFTDGVLTLAGSTVTPKSWSVTVDNHIDGDRFFNSRTLAGILALDRTTTVTMQIPFDTVIGTAIYNSGAAGAALAINHTNGNQTLNLSMPGLTFPAQGSIIPGRLEEMLQIAGVARRVALASELVITSNATP